MYGRGEVRGEQDTTDMGACISVAMVPSRSMLLKWMEISCKGLDFENGKEGTDSNLTPGN